MPCRRIAKAPVSSPSAAAPATPASSPSSAGITQQKVEGAGEQRKAERRHQEHRIGDPGRDQRKAEQDDEGDPLVGRAHLVCPNSPAGFTSRTSAMTTKITVLEAGG